MSNMVECVIDSIRVSLTNQQRIIVLREVNHERYLPIWIGPYEAEAITIALQEIEVARPQTHDLLKNLLNSLNARLLRVEVLTLRDDVFYGNLVIETDGHIIDVDARPSDALALGIRMHVPILVGREVLDSAGITPEVDIQNQPAPPMITTGSSSPAEESSEGRLSVFEDFLDKLDIDKLDNSSDEKPDEKPDDEPDDKKT